MRCDVQAFPPASCRRLRTIPSLKVVMTSTITHISDHCMALDLSIMPARSLGQSKSWLHDLPVELTLRVLYFLDIPELLATSRVGSHRSCKRSVRYGLLISNRHPDICDYYLSTRCCIE